MTGKVYCIAAATALVVGGASSPAAEPAPRATAAPKTVPPVGLLWPKGAPGARGEKNADKPTLTVFLPAKAAGPTAAVVICPGGGYGHLAIEKEGYKVARWLNSVGAAGFVLKYRHRRNGYGHPIPLTDAQRAVRTVRSRAAEWRVDPNQIGILGFSAGGHLASTAGTHYDRGKADAADPIDRASCRPDFMILIYPVVSLVEPFTHRGSKRNLLGAKPEAKLVESLSAERQVTADTPPTFLVHGSDDRVVPVDNSIYLYRALRKAKVPVEMHVYEKGRHGFGLGLGGYPHASWPARCADWMRSRGLIAKPS